MKRSIKTLGFLAGMLLSVSSFSFALLASSEANADLPYCPSSGFGYTYAYKCVSGTCTRFTSCDTTIIAHSTCAQLTGTCLMGPQCRIGNCG